MMRTGRRGGESAGQLKLTGATRAVVLGASFVFGLLLAGIGLPAQPLAAQEGPSRTALDGVYSESQAQRGLSTFRSSCGYCHTASEFAGAHFRRLVSGDQIFWFYEYIRFNMPQDAPGALPAQSYADIVAYILSMNEFPAGNEELPADAAVLRDIAFPDVNDEDR